MEISWTKTDNSTKVAIFRSLGSPQSQDRLPNVQWRKEKRGNTHTQSKKWKDRIRSLGSKNGARTRGRWEGEPGRK